MTKSIYRYSSFDAFVDIVQRKALTFVNYKLWEDTYECFLFRVVEKQEGINKVIEILRKDKYTKEQKMLVIDTITRFQNTIFGQSWSLRPESDALWRIYSHCNKSLRIEVNEENIQKLETVSIHPIEYENIGIEQQIDKMLKVKDPKGILDMTKIYLSKRKAFQHEKEVRLLSHIEMDNLYNTTPSAETLKNLKSIGIELREDISVSASNENSNEYPKVKVIKFRNIDGFISSVMLHPLATDWMDETVKIYCKRNKINYLGKSKLYTFQC